MSMKHENRGTGLYKFVERREEAVTQDADDDC